MIRLTAGLGVLGRKAEDLLTAVKRYIGSPKFDFSFEPRKDVKILSGQDEGKYAWIATNLLLGSLSEPSKVSQRCLNPSLSQGFRTSQDTYGVIDLGGGSVQVMLQTPPSAPDAVKTQVQLGQNTKVEVFVHSFLGYGLMAARMKVLMQPGGVKQCMPQGAQGSYKYGDDAVSFLGNNKAANFQGCLSRAIMVLNLNQECGQMNQCSFNGQWGGAKAKRFFLLSYLYERIYDSGAGKFDEAGTLGRFR